MQLIGFNLKKILAQKALEFKRGPINTNIEFSDVKEEEVPLLKDSNAVKISFIFSISYAHPEKTQDASLENLGEVSFEGEMMFSVTKDEFKEITKSWKKKQIPDQFRVPLINFILTKCSTKALSLEDDLNIPFHIPFPQVRPENKAQQDQ